MRSARLGLIGLAVAAASGAACQAYNMEEVEPQTVVAVETSGTFNVGKAPALLIVQDRSGSMNLCFTASGGGSGQCDSDGNGSLDTNTSSRMNVAQRVMRNAVTTNGGDVYFGLVLYGVDGDDPACGDPKEIAAPAPNTVDTLVNAYTDDPAITSPRGGTPTTKAIEQAYATLVDPSTGKAKMGERDNYVVLVTDGLMNCNAEHAFPCFCSTENGCSTADGRVGYGEEMNSGDARQCLDDDRSLAAVKKLRDAGVKTFVIGLGESFAGGGTNLAIDSLNRLADAGGMPRTGATERFYSAADEGQLEAALDDIIDKIVVPCEYELDGPVCDGRLVSISTTIDGQSVEIGCSPDAESSWYFATRGDGSLDERRITFSPDLCSRFGSATEVKISIRGVENACGGEVTAPSCDPTAN